MDVVENTNNRQRFFSNQTSCSMCWQITLTLSGYPDHKTTTLVMELNSIDIRGIKGYFKKSA